MLSKLDTNPTSRTSNNLGRIGTSEKLPTNRAIFAPRKVDFHGDEKLFALPLISSLYVCACPVNASMNISTAEDMQ